MDQRTCHELSQLLDHKRWKSYPTKLRAFWWILTFLYSPLGIVLCLVRLLTLIIFLTCALLLLPRSWSRSLAVQIIFPILGWRITVKHQEELERAFDEHRFFVLCLNHVSYLDSVMLLSLFHTVDKARVSLLASTLMGGETQWELLKRAGLLYETVYTRGTAASSSDKLKTREDIYHLIQSSEQVNPAKPLAIFPEGQVHNCDRGLLRYEKFCFGLGYPVVPIALTLRNHWPVNLWVVGERQAASWFYLLFFPWFQWDFEILSTIVADQGSSDLEIAQKAQEQTAQALNVTATQISLSEIAEYLNLP